MLSSRSARRSRTAEAWPLLGGPGIVQYSIGGNGIAEVGFINGRSGEVRSGEVRSGEGRSGEVRIENRGTGEDGS